jgi:Skp family chaperone for outer membrane proteins
MSPDPLVDIEAGNAGGVGAAVFATIPPEPELKGPLKPVAETTPKERIAGIIAGLAVALALAAMVIENSAVVLVAGILSIVMGPYAYYQQTKLTDIATLKETTAVLEVEVNRFAEENVKLESTVTQIGETIDELQDVEQALAVISDSEEQSVAALEKQVEEYQKILENMKTQTRDRVVQILISVIYRGDTNKDNIISLDEANAVIKGINDVSGVSVHAEKLRAAIVGKSIEAVVDVVQNLLRADIPAEDRIFIIEKGA